MKEEKHNLIKALSWYTIGSVLIRAVNFFTLKLFTDLLSTTDYGIFGIYQSYLGIFEITILFGTAHTIKMVKYDERYDYETYVGSIIYIPIIGTGFLIIILSIIACFTNTFIDLPVSIWYAIILSACFLAVANIVTGKFILEAEYKKYICYSLCNTILNIGISLLFCYTFFKWENAYWARILGNLFANIASCIYACMFIKIRVPNVQYIKKGVVLGAPLLIHSVATQILVQTDKIAISQLFSYSSVGIYTVAVNIAVIPMTILSSVENSWSPWFFERLSLSKYEEIKKKNTWILVLFAGGLGLFILGCPEVVKFMVHKDYWDAIYMLIPLTITAFAEMAYIIPLNLELYHKKNNTIWIYTAIAVAVNIIFDVIFIKLLGIMMAAYVTCFVRILLFLLHYIRAKRIDKHDIMDFKVVSISVVILFVVGRLTILLLEQWLVRWVLLIALGCWGGAFFFIKYQGRRGESI